MSELTQEQINEFWEWCGWKWHDVEINPEPRVKYRGSHWISPDDEQYIWTGNPPIDLNNLFRYAVPQALKVITEQGYCPSIMRLFQIWYDELVNQTGDSSNVEQAAPALFKVLNLVREQSK